MMTMMIGTMIENEITELFLGSHLAAYVVRWDL